ncbi:hypothetical protein [Nocardia africana]
MADTPSIEQTGTGELIDIATLEGLDGTSLPGATITIEGFQSRLADYALLSADDDSGDAHLLWELVLALRGMGITVDELCTLAGQRPKDVLLFGNCRVVQHRPLRVGGTFAVTATIGPVSRKQTKRGGILDFVTVRTTISEENDPADRPAGEVVNGYIFKRGA